MLFLKVNGRSPGDFLAFKSESKIEVEVRVRVRSPIYPVRCVEIIQNGRVVERKFAPAGRAWWEFAKNVSVSESGWIAVRAYGDAGTDAHTNPVYLFVDGKRPFALPVIVTDKMGPKELVRHGENGFITTDSKDMRDKLQMLIDDEPLRKKMGGQARDYTLTVSSTASL